MNEVYLLVGGEATRLQPLSFGIPKALLKIKNKPIIEYIFEEYLKIGDFNFNLICSSKHKEIWQHYKIDSKFKFNILVEEMKLDTAGYIVQNLETFPEKIFCMNGDLLLDINLDKFIIESNNNSISTIGSIEVSDPTRYGVLLLNQNNIISEFIEKPSDDRFGNKISVGLYHLYKSDIEKIRGVNCDYTIQKLLDKNLIKIEGKSDKLGRPLIYSTSEKFMDYFGINSLDQLPTLKDFQEEENTIGDEKEI